MVCSFYLKGLANIKSLSREKKLLYGRRIIISHHGLPTRNPNLISMAFNWQSFKTRTLTAAIFVVVMLAGLLWSGLSFILLFTIIHFGCWYEFARLAKKIKPFTYGY